MDQKIEEVLNGLHQAARSDKWKIARGIPAVLFGLLRGIDVNTSIAPYLDHAYIPVSPESGRFLFQTALAAGARNIVEFGTSYGISTLYLAAAARKSGGQVIGTEMLAAKHSAACAHMAKAGVGDIVDIRLGDALQTLLDVPDNVDFVLLDGWKQLYMPVFDMLLPKLAPGAIIIADNIFTFRRALAPYVARMQARGSGFHSVTLPIGAGMEFSVRAAC